MIHISTKIITLISRQKIDNQTRIVDPVLVISFGCTKTILNRMKLLRNSIRMNLVLSTHPCSLLHKQNLSTQARKNRHKNHQILET